MATVSSIAQLNALIKSAVKEGMAKVGEESKKVVKQHIDSDVYNSYSPSYYHRTHQLRESVDVKEVGDLGIEIYHDTSKIGSYPENIHMSVVDGSSSADYIPEIVHDGLSGNIWGDGGGYLSSRPYMDNSEDEIRNSGMAGKEMKKVLKSKGFKV